MICFRVVALLTAALAAWAADFHLDLPAVRSTFEIAGQPVAIAVSGRVAARGDAAAVTLDADLAGLQEKILPILRAQLDQDNRCGDRLSIEQATLSPEAPSALLKAMVHYEKFACAKAFGKEIVKRLVGGNAMVRARLTAVVDAPAAVRLDAKVLPIEADGQLGEILRSGQFGAALSEKIRKTLQSDLEKSAALHGALPPAVQSVAALRSAAFRDGGGRLVLSVSGDLQATVEQVAGMVKDVRQ